MAELAFRTGGNNAADSYAPRMVANTGNKQDEDASLIETHAHPQNPNPDECVGSTIFKQAQWSPDGTSILTSSEDRTLQTFILPPTLLEGSSPQTLLPYSSHQAPSPIYATSIHPSFSLNVPSAALYVASPAALPIRLLSPFSASILGSYPLIHAPTERYVTPHSLLFSSLNPNHFVAGSDSLLSIFDISRPSEAPVVSLRTIPSKRNPRVGGGVGMKGIVSALALSPDGVLAAGTFTRWLGLYDRAGAGDTIAVFPLSSPVDEQPMDGQGVTSLHWSSCNRYLAVAERGSTSIGVWDIRGTGKRLAWLVGRKAASMQRLGVAVRAAGLGVTRGGEESIEAAKNSDSAGDEIWAGGTDGSVWVWTGLGQREGSVEPSWSFKAHDDAVGGLDWHPWGDVLATCSGARHFREQSDSEDDGSDEEHEVHTVESLDCSLRIWAFERAVRVIEHMN